MEQGRETTVSLKEFFSLYSSLSAPPLLLFGHTPANFSHPSWHAGHRPADALEEDIPVWHNSSFHAIYTQISDAGATCNQTIVHCENKRKHSVLMW